MVINTRHSFPKTFLAVTLLTLSAERLTAQTIDLSGARGLLDNKPLISIQTVADPAENEIEDATRSGRNLDVTAASLNSVFDDVYEKCLVNMSFPCLQRKMVVYMNKMDRMKGVNVISNFVTVVRTAEDRTPEITEDALEKKIPPAEEETQLEQLMEHQVDKFMDNHVIRLKLPEGVTAGLQGRSYAGNAVDISISRMFSIIDGFDNSVEDGAEEGRKKKGGGKKSKKMMGMMMMGLMGKKAILIKICLMLLKIKALKALIIAKLALALSLIGIIKSVLSKSKGGMSGGMGSSKEVIIVHDSHGDSGSSGGGWSSGGSSGGHGGGGGGGGGWSSGGGGGGGHPGGDSYSSGHHGGGGDATYSGGDSGGGGWSSGGGGGGWGKRSWDPATNTHITHTTWPLYKSAYAAAAAASNDEAL